MDILTWDEYQKLDILRKKQYLTLLNETYHPTRMKMCEMFGTTKGKLDYELHAIGWESGNQRGERRRKNEAILQTVNAPAPQEAEKADPAFSGHTCRSCGYVLINGAKFCHMCGTEIKTERQLFIEEIEAALDDLVQLKRPDRAIKALNRAIEWVGGRDGNVHGFSTTQTK